MTWMAGLLGTSFLAITFLLGPIGAVPSEQETVISQLARTVYGSRGLLYLATLAGTTVILILASNTAFAGFPRLSAIIADDGFMPRQLTFRGTRLVYSRGIVVLAAVAGLLIFIFQASVTALVPLWAVGVFLSFTLSQAGIARRWWRAGRQTPAARGWVWRMVVNGVGAVCTAVVTLVFAVTKFREGAWIVLLLLPAMVAGFYAIHRHYQALRRELQLDGYRGLPRTRRHRVIVPIGAVHRGTLEALDYARWLSADVTAVHIAFDSDQAERLREKWAEWGEGVRLVIIESPYRAFLEPFLDYVEKVSAAAQDHERITIVVGQFVPQHGWHNLLHAQTAFWLRSALLARPRVVVTEVPFQVD